MRPICSCSRPRRGSALKVFGIAFLVIVLICGGVVTYLALNMRSLAVSVFRKTVMAAMAQSDLPDEQKARIRGDLDQLGEDFKDKKVSYEQIGLITEKLAEGPFFGLLQVQLVESAYRDTCNPAEPKRSEVALAFDRFERGIMENKISAARVRDDLAMVQESKQDNHASLKKNLTEGELNAFVDQITKDADAAAIPREPFQVDFAAQIREAIDGVLKGIPTTGPATTPSSAPAGVN